MIRWIVVAGLAVVVAVSMILFNPLSLLPEGDADVIEAVVREQGEITVNDLSTTHEADGELRFAEQREVSDLSGSGGTLTALAPLGETVGGSSILYEVDGVPTVALAGDVPAWRTMTVDDVGVDVAQLETSLVALGYDPEEALTVDDTYTSYTADVVARWQEDVGLAVTGSVDLGSVVFIPSDSSVATVSGVVGSTAQGALLTVASAERELVFPVAGELLDTIEIGTEVSARLPDRSTVTALVVELAPSGDGSWAATAEVQPGESGDDAVLPEGDAVPLTVSWVEPIADGAMTVQASALARLDDGTYAIEVVGDDGTEFVPVEIGARSGSTIEIVTDLEVGTAIIVP